MPKGGSVTNPNYYDKEETADYCTRCQEPVPARYLFAETDGYYCEDCIIAREMENYQEYVQTNGGEV